MTDKAFQTRLRKIISEQSFGYPVYGVPSEEIPGQTVDDIQQDAETAGGAVVGVVPDSTGQTTVTNGETTPIDEPRSDVESSSTNGNGNEVDDANAEVSSLLITIGYILQGKGVVSDKFNTSDVVAYINTNFGKIQNALPGPQDDGVEIDAVAVGTPDIAVPPSIPVQPPAIPGQEVPKPGMQPYFEGRRLLESKRMKRANNKGSGKK